MDSAPDPFGRANLVFRQQSYRRWQRSQSQQQILRSQVGFARPQPSRPEPCQQCRYYHGIAYGTSRERRSLLVCGIHPTGWTQDNHCPDWAAIVPWPEA